MKYIVANWKQNMNMEAANLWTGVFKSFLPDVSLRNIIPVVCPPSTLLEFMSEALDGTGIRVGAQNVDLTSDGAHTGNIGVEEIKDFAKYCIVGHSEMAEDRETTYQKAAACLKAGIIPIICTKKDDPVKKLEHAIYAIEDMENISQNGIYNPKSTNDIEKLAEKLALSLEHTSTIIYGGSVNSQNAEQLAKIRNLDGVLIGHASLNAETFVNIIKAFSAE